MAFRASVGGTRSSASRRWIASTLLSRNRLASSRAITAPAPATPAVTAAAASTPKAALRSNAAAIQPTASTASQPTKSTATPARPKVMTRSRRRGGVTRGRPATGAGSLGVTRSVRSVGMICGANGRRGATSSVASTSITRAHQRSARVGLIAHRSRSPSRNSSARSRLMWAIPSTGEGSMAGGSNTGTLRKGEPQASARGGRIGTLPTKNFDCVVAADRPADHHLQALAVDLLRIFRRRDDGGERRDIQLRIAAPDLERGERRHVAQQRRQMVALDVGNMIGLGGGEQHLVDVRTEQQLGEDAAVSVAEALAEWHRARAACRRRRRDPPAARAARRPARSGASSAGSGPGRTAPPPRACRPRSALPSARPACGARTCRRPRRRRAAQTTDRAPRRASPGTGTGRAGESSGRGGRAPRGDRRNRDHAPCFATSSLAVSSGRCWATKPRKSRAISARTPLRSERSVARDHSA